MKAPGTQHCSIAISAKYSDQVADTLQTGQKSHETSIKYLLVTVNKSEFKKSYNHLGRPFEKWCESYSINIFETDRRTCWIVVVRLL